MSSDFATAMRRALEQTRASDPAAATATIQAALKGAPLSDAPAPRSAPGAAHRTAQTGNTFPTIDLSTLKSEGSFPNIDLSALRGGASGATPAPVDLPSGARVEWRRHTAPTGTRDVRLFMPSSREGGPKGLLILLHGCTQSPEDFARGTRMDAAAEDAGFVVATPHQTSTHNAQSCWNWFRADDQSAGRGEAGMLAHLAETLAAEFDLAGRVHAAGLSAGGAMAAILGDTRPDLFASIGVHSGLPAGAANDMPQAFAAMRGDTATGRAPRVPAIVFHGTTDRTVSPRNATRLVPGDGIETQHTGNGRSWTQLTTPKGHELWLVKGGGHTWFGGDPSGSHTDAQGPDASSEMLRFFTSTRTTK